MNRIVIFLDGDKVKKDEVVDKILNEMVIIRRAKLKCLYIDIVFALKYKDKEMTCKSQIVDTLEEILINLAPSEIREKLNEFHNRINEKYQQYCITVGNDELSFWLKKSGNPKKVIRELTREFVREFRKVIYELISENNKKGLDKWLYKEMTFKL